MAVIHLEHNRILKTSSSVKHLGIYIDSSLNQKTHIEHLSKKLSKLIYLFYQLREAVGIEVLIQVYYAHVYSNIRYGILFWGNSTSVDIILRLQKRCIRLMTNSKPTDTARPIFRRLGLLTVIDIFILECASFVKMNPGFFESRQTTHSYDTRNCNNLVTVQTRLGYVDKGPVNMCVRIFNQIPRNIKVLETQLFKKELRALLLGKNYYDIREFLD